MSGPKTRHVWADERGIIVSGLVKLLIGLAIAGLVLMEAGQIVFARITVRDLADRAAAAGANAYGDTGSIDAAHDAVVEVLDDDDDAKLKRFVVDPAERSVRVVIRKRASTLIVDKIGFLEGLTIAEGKATGLPPPV
jgi:hypothetical protein